MQEIVAENLGPIEQFTFQPAHKGVTVFRGPNGVGKSILQRAIQDAASGQGKLPLRDHTKQGKFEGFGARITIGGKCRHTGEFEVHHIEGRFDISSLIDPKLKTPSAADAARIKALVSLTGVEADEQLFKDHEAFADFDSVVKAASVKTDDLVEMARRIKADYDESARSAEDEAEREDGHANGLSTHDDLDMSAPSDAAELDQAADECRDVLTKLRSEYEWFESNEAAYKEAKASLAEGLPDTAEIEQQISDCNAELQCFDEQIKDLEDRLATLQSKRTLTVQKRDNQKQRLADAQRAASQRERLQKLVDQFEAREKPDEEVIESKERELQRAREARETGALIRQAKKEIEQAKQHRKKASEARDRAERYRQAGRSTDDVLSLSITSGPLRIESDGKSARLMTDTDRGPTPYHELSDGQRAKIAIDIGAECVGKDGLLVVDQQIWEGLDGDNRQLVHEHAKALDLYIFTFESTKEPGAPKEITPVPFGGEGD